MEIEVNADIPTGASLKSTLVQRQAPNVTYADKILFAWRLSEGQGSVVRDVVGSQDGIITGATWTASDSYLDGQALDGDGTDDHVDTSPWMDFGSNMGSDFSIAFTINTLESAHKYIAVDEASDGMQLYVRDGGNAAGDVNFRLQDEGNNTSEIASASTWNDGANHRMVINKKTNNASNWEIWVDGSDDTGSVISDQGFGGGTLNDFSIPVYLLAGNDRGSPSGFVNGTMDNVLVMGDSLTQQEIVEDYHAQPWVTPSVSNVTAVNY